MVGQCLIFISIMIHMDSVLVQITLLEEMEESSAYVPPKYMPIRRSDAETDLGSVDGGRQNSHTLTGDLNQWSSGICVCFDDPRRCCLGTLCPCILFGKNAESFGSGPASRSCTAHCLLWGLLAGMSCILTGGILLVLMPGCTIACCASQNRRALREKYNLLLVCVYVAL